MLFDLQALYSDRQAITADAPSTNFINHGLAGTPPNAPAPIRQDIGGANDIQMATVITEAFVGGTSLNVIMEMADSSDFSDAETVAASGEIVTSNLGAGEIIGPFTVPPKARKRYSRLRYDVTGTFTAGTVMAGITAGIQTNVG